MKSYSKATHYASFQDRFDYLKLKGKVGFETFGVDRYLNQVFYQSPKWRTVRDTVILRDNGCDLGVPGYEIYTHAIVHHINPITYEDLMLEHDCLYDMDNLITVSFATHNAIHYGDPTLLAITLVEERKPYDTCPWKR